MDKKKVLVLDRAYCVKYMKSDVFDVLIVCLDEVSKQKHLKEGLKVIACFDEDYDNLPIAAIPNNYLIHSFDSDRCLKKYDYNKRLEILGKEISFWSNIFEKYKPDCIVNEVVTIEWMEVMFLEAHKRGIPYYNWGTWPFDKQDILVKDSPFDSRRGSEYWENITEEPQDVEKAQKYIELVRGGGRKPFYIKKRKEPVIQKKLKSLFGYGKAIYTHFLRFLKRDKFYYGDSYYTLKQDLKNKWCKLLYHKYDTMTFSEDTEYFFYPIHYEPEATVEYYGFHFNDQKMLISRIAHTLKTNQKLILKEHPQQPGLLMNQKYRELKKTYSNLVFLQGGISSYDIYPHIKCLITLTGTAGFESWICKRPVIVFGEVFYKDFPGMIACDSFKQLYDIVRNDKYTIADDAVITSYVAKMYHQIIDLFPFVIPGFSTDEDLLTMTKNVEGLLNADK